MKISILLVLCLSIQTIYSQSSVRLQGTVVKSGTSEPLEGVNVTVVQTQVGDATDESGYFEIPLFKPGEYELLFQLIGFKPHRKKIRIDANKKVQINIELEPQVIEGSEVTVEGERVEDTRIEITPPSFTLKPQAVETIAGAQEDVIRSVLSLPGVQGTNDFTNQFIVRGGGPDQNLILLDDVEIYNPYRNSGMPSFINPAIVRDINLYAGGYPALFGDRLSSVLTVHTRDGSTQKWISGKAALSLANANFLLEGKMPVWNGSWFIGTRRTYNGLFTNDQAQRITPNDVALPDYEDWHLKFALHPSPKHRLQFHTILGKTNQDFLVKAELGEQDAERESLDGGDQVKTQIFGGSWSYLAAPHFQVKLHMNRYKNVGNSSFSGNFVPTNPAGIPPPPDCMFCTEPPPLFAEGDSAFVFDHNQRFDFEKYSIGGWAVYEKEQHTLESGFGIDYLNNSVDSQLRLSDFGEVVVAALHSAPNWFGALGDSIDQSKSYRRGYFYLQDKWKLSNRFFVQPGLRLDYYELINRTYLSPRMKAAFEIDPVTTLSAAGGIYRQSPGFEKLLDGGEVFDLLRFEDLTVLAAERAVHGVLGLERRLTDQWRVTVESYYKKFDNLIEQEIELVQEPGAVYIAGPPALAASYRVEDRLLFRKLAQPSNGVTGDAYGLDFHLEKRVVDPRDRLFGWLSYSFGKSNRKQTFDGVQFSYPNEFDRRHSLDFVLNYRIDSDRNDREHITLGLTWRYGTGFPYTPALGVEPLVAEIADPLNPENIRPAILADPDNGAAKFIPSFGGPENINSLRYPDYVRLDARVTYSTKLMNARWQFYLDVINVFNSKNVLFYRSIIRTEVDTSLPQGLQFLRLRAFEEPVYMYPFLPSFGISVAF